MGIKKRKISRWLRIRWKRFWKNAPIKLLAKTWWKHALFSLLLMFVKLVFLITFLVHFLKTYSTDLKSAWNSAFFKIFSISKKKLSYEHFLKTLKPNTHKTAQKTKKNVFCKCGLDLNFASIKGSVFFIFKKSQIRCTLLYCTWVSLVQRAVE